MLELTAWILVLIASLVVLLKASDWFTSAAEKIGLYFKVPAFIVGVTIVSIGTSLPELVSATIAVAEGSPEIMLGNVMGANITNIFLILGLAAFIARKKIVVAFNLVNVDLPFMIGAALLLFFILSDGQVHAYEALIAIVGYVAYLMYTIQSEKKKDHHRLKAEIQEEHKGKTGLGWGVWSSLGLSVILIYFGAQYTVDAVVRLAEIFRVGKELIAVSVVALGTTLPELAVSLNATRKGLPEMVVGNILGSNIFNAFAVVGVSSLFGAVIVPETLLQFALPLMIGASLMYFVITQDKQITKWEGLLLLSFYLFFVGTTVSLL